MANPIVLSIGDFSDGDATKHPTTNTYSISTVDVYRYKIAALWAKARAENGDSTINPNQKYILDRLPQGYEVFEKPRGNNPAHKDRYLFGHPRGGGFDSPNKFFPHFQWLMNHASSTDHCKCVLCDRTLRAPRVPKLKDRAPVVNPSDGNSHAWQKLLKKLKEEGNIDQDIKDQEDMELAVSQQSLDETFAEICKSPAYRHRIGELVLFHDSNRDTLVRFKVDPVTQKKIPLFKWMAGVISLQNDEENEPLVEGDLFLEKNKRWAITYSGFKVEVYSDPDAEEPKEWIKQMVYVPLHRIRPFHYWEEVLADIPMEKWHPTIHHTMSVLSSISVLDCFHINGVWPSFATSCRSVWIGAELICVGDVVRLKPKQQHDQQITDVLVVDSMTALGEDCEHSKLPYKLHLTGKTFTTNANHKDDDFRGEMVSKQTLYTKLPRSMFGRVWYYLHGAEDNSIVSVDCVVGRMHGDIAMAAWFGKPGNFDIGLRGLLQGREYSRGRYGYSEEGCWHWAETRAKQLKLMEINEVYLGRMDKDIEPSRAREHMKELNSHGVDSGALDGGLVDSPPDNQEHLHGSTSASAVLSGRSPGKPTRKNTQSEEDRSKGGEDSSEEADELIHDATEGRGLPGDEDGSEQDSDNESEEDELSTPNVKRLKIKHH